MDLLEIAMIGIAVMVAVNVIAPKIGIASPLLLVLLGIGISFLPVVAPIEIKPDWILGGILPPLLYSSAVNMPAMDFRRDLRTISAFSVLLVIGSAVVIGYVMSRLIPDIDLATGIALGAIISPTDAVATSIVKRAGVAPRLVTVLEGESLLNDASALVLLRSATAATALLTGSIAADFVWAVVVAVVVGLVIGRLNLVVRAHIHHPTSNVAISLVVPFFAYIPAERLEASGLVAAVVAGLVTGHGAPKYLRPQDRITADAVWRTLEMLLESAIFLLMGLELYGLIVEVHNAHGSVWTAIRLGLLASLLVISVRAVFVAPSLWLLARRARRGTAIRDRIASVQDRLQDGSLAPRTGRRGRSDDELDRQRVDRTERISTSLTRRLADIDYLAAQAFGWREGAVLVWAGMRGAVTLAAAQSLPADTPQRSLLVLIAFVVAAGTLMVQGSTLGWLVRLLSLTGRDSDADVASARELQSQLLAQVGDRLARDELTKVNGEPFAPATLEWARRVITTITVDPEEREAEGEDLRSERGELRLAVIELQRAKLLEIRDLGTYPSAVLEDMLTQLDADQLSLELRSTS
ncbi:MAG TPA: sodium:proton antiporter [Microlunatus sp.]|nr:sodium:proton antiporter [Microlunatus sp.]